jgi:DNA-binding CsgD family transcriptional regulator
VLLDKFMCDVMWTKNAQSLLVAQVGYDWRNLLIPRLREWVKQTGLMHDKIKSFNGARLEHLILDSYSLECYAYKLGDHILINFKHHASGEAFAVLEKCGLTGREIQVLSYLRFGYSNRQIATAINIREVTVKKHIGHIGYKLDAVGRTMILRRAEQRKRLLSE